MHELSLVSSLLAKAEEVADAEGARRITAVAVRIGALSHLSPEHLRNHLNRAAPGSMLEGARVDVTVDHDMGSPNAQGIELLAITME